MIFPEDFVWGAATASYQIEGAVKEDGRGQSIWDTFSHSPGNVANGDTGDMACDHYHRYADDVELMRELRLAAYRFSVAWPRIQPDGSGPANPRGLAFYDRLVDRLLAAEISPYVTLYHWDLPQALQERGGWTDRDTAHRFAEYAAAVYDRLGDRVRHWATLNEPWVSAFLGYGNGVHAPGRRDPGEAMRAAHHLLLGHGLAAARLRELGAPHLMLVVNSAPVLTPAQVNDPSATPGEADAAATERVHALLTGQFLDPVIHGRYPEQVLEAARRNGGTGHIHDGDLEIIATPIDQIGINYYNPCVVEASPGQPADAAWPGSEDVGFRGADAPTTAMGWPIVPDGLSRLLVRLSGDYPGVSFMVTENGAAFDDVVENGRVHDTDRVSYLEGHLREAHRAVEAGVDLRGYLVWSLLDNFEWAEGYSRRFGIVHVDYATQVRVPKDSALWFRDVIVRNGL
ncbi:GH1 family beta-glucosidase [Nonomuraea muscovyensis]|uniref:Beta-glucosidase n=1 Tax=Nonomuraea muscovyensis TaxID=1124761 RepID=A0A7X0CBD2_9ACTN|nr:GH1 family beta-glucosidase [Nonomuraea muscovyensis]MBB6351031.1 beta-glucosidase [Nonomuraea muscovyensis]